MADVDLAAAAITALTLTAKMMETLVKKGLLTEQEGHEIISFVATTTGTGRPGQNELVRAALKGVFPSVTGL